MPKMKVWNGTTWITLDANDADTVDGKHASDFAPSSHVGSGGSAHAVATTSVAGFMSATDKAKLDGIQSGAEVNQNTFSNVKVGNTTITADSKTDTLELVAGSNITLTPDEVNDKVTISATVPVTSVNGRTGAVSLSASDVGASPTGHTHAFADITSKPTTLAGYGITDAIPNSQRGSVNGVASLDESARVPTSQLPIASTVSAGIVQLNNTLTSTSTAQAATANAVKQVNDTVVAHLADNVKHITAAERTIWNSAEANAKAYTDTAPEAMQRNLGIFNVYKSGKDSNGIFTTVKYKRADGTLYAQSVLSGGTSPQYTTRTITYYAADGTTVLRTDTCTLTYDADGDLISEVKQ